MAIFSSKSTKALFYDYPWQGLGHLKYLIYMVGVALAIYQVAVKGIKWQHDIYIHTLILTAIRYLLFQVWGSITRLPSISRKHQIVKKGITFEQIDHEANWENILIPVIMIIVIIPKDFIYQGSYREFQIWNGKGIALCFLLHVGPVEWLYYWAHRALHHHYLFTSYHRHHHMSFVAQPITSSNHPMLEGLFYNALFAIPTVSTIMSGLASLAMFYIYILFIDFMNAWGHSNFEFIPKEVFDMLPPLKYLIYSPTFHSLHHTKVHTNFALFMPIYDYIYGTMDPTTDELHQQVRKGSMNKVDCVYLSHPTSLLSVFHLPFGFQTFASQPFSQKWYIQVMLPLVFPIMLMLWLFASPFIVATHFIGKNFELQTWMIPRFKYQYNMECEKLTINGWIENCIMEAQDIGAKVIALGLWNKDRVNTDFIRSGVVTIPIVNGETLTSIVIAKKIMARNTQKVFLSDVDSRVGRAIAIYLCEHDVKVMALFHSIESYKCISAKIHSSFQKNLIFVSNYDDGKCCKVWIVGEDINANQQQFAPQGSHFHTFNVFPLSFQRDDCTYECVPSLQLPDHAKTINACEDVLPRNVVRVCYAAGMIHSLENWRHNDLDEEITTHDMERSWNAAMEHKFSLYDNI